MKVIGSILITLVLCFLLLFQASAQITDSVSLIKYPEPDWEIKPYNTTSFTSDVYVKGKILLPDSAVKEGLIKFNGNTVHYKPFDNKDSEKYKADGIIGFITKKDTVYVVPGFRNLTDKTFAKQYASGKTIVAGYSKTSSSYGGYGGIPVALVVNYTKMFFYIKRKENPSFMPVPKNKKDFKRYMSDYFADRPDIVKRIESGDLNHDNLHLLIYMHNNDVNLFGDPVEHANS